MKERYYLGESEASDLCDWLNDRKTLKKHRKLHRLIETAVRYHATRDDKLHSQLCYQATMLVDFNFFPLVGDIDHNRWDVSWETTADDEPGLAVWNFLQLAQDGLLHTLRRCAYAKCNQWYFAKYNHLVFHSKKCRKEAAREDTHKREARREYERRYYRANLSKAARKGRRS